MDILKSIIIWLIGIAFILILFPLTFIIWLLVLPFDKHRTVVHWLLIYQSLLLSYIIPLWKIKVEGRDKVVKGLTYVVISNHQSILDILLLNSLRLQYKWISKRENMKVPFLGWYLRMADYLTVDRGNPDSKEQMMADAYLCLRNGISVMLFPEGTRSVDGEIGLFKRGAFQLAISAKTPILPVLIDGTGGVLPKHGIIFGGFHKITIRIFDPVLPESFGTDDCNLLALNFHKMMSDELVRLRNEG